MTTRAAILIASPTVNYGSYSATCLEGTKEDIKEWKRFLTIPIGGCWYDSGPQNEIFDMSDQTQSMIFKQIEKLKGVDYIFFVYSGHGISTVSDDFIFPNHGRDCISVHELKKAIAETTTKGTLLINACRNQNPYFNPNLSFTAPTIKPELLLEASDKTFRNMWDKAFEDSLTTGIVTIFSCERGKESYMYPPNGQYSLFYQMMFDVINRSKDQLNVGKAFKSARDNTRNFATNKIVSGDQVPFCDNEDVDYPLSLGSTWVQAEYLMG